MTKKKKRSVNCEYEIMVLKIKTQKYDFNKNISIHVNMRR